MHCARQRLQQLHLILADLLHQPLSVPDEVAVKVHIAGNTLAVDVIFVETEGCAVPCGKEVAGVHLVEALGVTAGNAGEIATLVVPFSDVGVKMLCGQSD